MSAEAAAAAPPKVVICGGGIIGCSVAYHLARRGIPATVVERAEVAAAASGKAAGFLAEDWCDASPVGPLARRSFELHAQLAEEFGHATVGYRGMRALAVTASAGGGAPPPKGVPAWLTPGPSRSVQPIGAAGKCAQVHPRKLTRALIADAETRGTRVVSGVVAGIVTSSGSSGGGSNSGGSGGAAAKAVTGVQLADGTVLDADVVVLAMGPWTGRAAAWLGARAVPPMRGQKYTHINVRADVPAEAVFFEFRDADGAVTEPELYPRGDGEVYVCALPQPPITVPEDGPETVRPAAADVAELRRLAGVLSPQLKDAEVVCEECCYLPIPPDSVPIIGRVPGCDGAYIATGHGCWGILNAPATGEALAQLIAEGTAPLDLSPFDPARFFGAHAAA